MKLILFSSIGKQRGHKDTFKTPAEFPTKRKKSLLSSTAASDLHWALPAAGGSPDQEGKQDPNLTEELQGLFANTALHMDTADANGSVPPPGVTPQGIRGKR